MCFTVEGGMYPCTELTDCSADKDNKCYTWSFGDGSDESNIMGNVNHFYRAKRNYQTTLQICDEYYCCIAGKMVNVSTSKAGEIPFWKEISPF
jgi:hypothetical protein